MLPVYIIMLHVYIIYLACGGTLFNVQANNVVIYSLVFEEALKFYRGRVSKFI